MFGNAIAFDFIHRTITIIVFKALFIVFFKNLILESISIALSQGPISLVFALTAAERQIYFSGMLQSFFLVK